MVYVQDILLLPRAIRSSHLKVLDVITQKCQAKITKYDTRVTSSN